MKSRRTLLSTFVLTVLVALTFVTPAYAFDGRGGDRVVIEAGEVINDDLYVGAQEFVLNGTVNGDLIAFPQNVVALTFVTPAYAFDGRGGDRVVIEAGE